MTDFKEKALQKSKMSIKPKTSQSHRKSNSHSVLTPEKIKLESFNSMNLGESEIETRKNESHSLTFIRTSEGKRISIDNRSFV